MLFLVLNQPAVVHFYILPNIMVMDLFNGMCRGPDNEERVFFVRYSKALGNSKQLKQRECPSARPEVVKHQ